MFLYKDPSGTKLFEYKKALKNTDYSFVRLCRTGNCGLLKLKDYESLFDIHPQSPDFFAVEHALRIKVANITSNTFFKFLLNIIFSPRFVIVVYFKLLNVSSVF